MKFCKDFKLQFLYLYYVLAPMLELQKVSCFSSVLQSNSNNTSVESYLIYKFI